MKTKKAVKTLSKALRKDKDLYYGYQANIAMSFKDEYYRQLKKKDYRYMNGENIHNVANEAAKSFLNLLIKK